MNIGVEYIKIIKLENFRHMLIGYLGKIITQHIGKSNITHTEKHLHDLFIKWFFYNNMIGNIVAFFPKRFEIIEDDILFYLHKFKPIEKVDIDHTYIQQLLQSTSSSSKPSKVTFKLEGGKTSIMVNDIVVRTCTLHPKQIELLRSKYVGSGMVEEAIAILSMRYKFLNVLSEHFSVQPHYIQELGADMELFGTSFNTIKPYCSPFPDVEALFGSRGNFFHYDITPGIYVANPPFDEVLMEKMAEKLLVVLDTTPNVLFIINIPVWDSVTQEKYRLKNYRMRFKAYELLHGSKYLVESKVLDKNKYQFYDYFSDKNIGVCHVHFMLLSNFPPPEHVLAFIGKLKEMELEVNGQPLPRPN